MRYPSEASMKCGRNSTTEKSGMWDTQISAIGGSPTVSGGFSRYDERLSRPLGEPCHVHMGDSVPDFISYLRSTNIKCQSASTFVMPSQGGTMHNLTPWPCVI